MMRRRHLATLVACMLLGGVCAAASAQGPKAAPPAPAAAQAAPAAANGGVPQPERTMSTYGDWVVRCEVRPTTPPTRLCELAATALDARQQPVLQVVIGATAPTAQRVLVVQLPLNVGLPAEPRLVIDDKDKPFAVPLRSCLPRGCFAETELGDAVVARLRALGDGAVHFEYKDAAQAPISVSISMKGFATGLDALAREHS
jgi:invasion protein IalB